MEDLHWIWKTILIFYLGRFILRIGGRKSISQMTITQVVVMVGIGSLLIQPIAGENLLTTFGAALVITLLMALTEYIEMKSDLMETVSTGKALMVIENGELQIENLKKLRMSVDRLETRLRQNGITAIDDVKYATIEVSGQLGYELKDHKNPLTKEDFLILMGEIKEMKNMINGYKNNQSKQDPKNNIFQEVKGKKTNGKKEP